MIYTGVARLSRRRIDNRQPERHNPDRYGHTRDKIVSKSVFVRTKININFSQSQDIAGKYTDGQINGIYIYFGSMYIYIGNTKIMDILHVIKCTAKLNLYYLNLLMAQNLGKKYIIHLQSTLWSHTSIVFVRNRLTDNVSYSQKIQLKNNNYDDYFCVKILKGKPKSLSQAFRIP